jgi:hypothetical protein
MFRFTIRDVLWLTVVVALGVGCWRLMVVNTRLEMAVWATTKKLEDLGYSVVFDRNQGTLSILGGP